MIASVIQDILTSFVPLFVAMDALGVLPIVMSLTQGMEPQRRAGTVRYAILTALGLGLGFLAIGKGVFWLLGISVADFLVAGGLILLLLSAKDLVMGKLVEAQTLLGQEMLGVVPIGTPLVVGPAVLTTLLLLVDQYPVAIVLIALVLNLALAWLVFSQANRIARFLGRGGLGAVAKVMSLLLAAIAIKMMRQGILGILAM